MPHQPDHRPIDTDNLMAFVFRAVDEVGATLNCALVVMGDRLGYYRAWPTHGPLTPAELAAAHRHRRALRPRVAQRPGRRRLRRPTTPTTGTYTLPPEHAVALTDETSPAYLPGFFQIALGTIRDADRILEAARDGDGLGWHEHNTDVHDGLRALLPARSTTPTSSPSGCPRSTASSTSSSAGATVADIGCGHGASTILMAQAFPASHVRRLRLPRGLDRRRPRAGAEAGVADRIEFEVAPATAFSGHRLRPGHDVRRPARHGRPGRRGAARPRGPRPRRHLDGRRAGGRRPRRGQPQPGRPGLLRLLDPAVHAGVAVPGRRARRSAPRPARPGSATSSTAAGFTQLPDRGATPFNNVFEVRP